MHIFTSEKNAASFLHAFQGNQFIGFLAVRFAPAHSSAPSSAHETPAVLPSPRYVQHHHLQHLLPPRKHGNDKGQEKDRNEDENKDSLLLKHLHRNVTKSLPMTLPPSKSFMSANDKR